MLDLYHYREGDESRIDGIDKWLWLKSDNGAWDGPKRDWETSHKENILKYVKNFDVVVQAGGCQGMYPKLLSKMFKTVYTFEPSSDSFYALVHNCPEHNIVKFNAALGNKHTMVSLDIRDTGNVGTHRIKDNEKSHIPQLMVDDLDLPACDLIYLDIEGYEENALKGAVNTINKFSPVIFAENGNKAETFMGTLGYHVVGNSVSDTIFIKG
jgi:FkbM family methyltransferase